MPPTPKPDASYASNLLKRTNYGRSSLLSVVDGKSTREPRTPAKTYKESSGSDSSDPLSTEETMSKPKPKPKPKSKSKSKPNTLESEVDIEAPPQSSTDDGSVSPASELDDDLEDSRSRSRKTSDWSAKELGAKLAQDDTEEEEESTPKNKNRRRSTPQTAVKRSKRVELSRKDTLKETKRRRSGTATPEKPKLKAEKEGDEGPSAPLFVTAKRRRRQNTYGGASTLRNIHAAAPKPVPSGDAFKVPIASSGETDKAVHSSQASTSAAEFKNPLHYFPDCIPDSSFPTETSRGDENAIFDLDLDPDGSISSLSSPSSSASRALAEEDKTNIVPPLSAATTARCPVCDEPVDDELAERYGLSKGLTTKKKLKICHDHRIRTAELEWAEKGYPTIDWEQLEERIERHFPGLENILTLKDPSFYRNLLESSTKSGGSIRLTVNSEMDSLSAGYYGGRGSKKMAETIISRFATKIRHLAPSDSLMQAAGVSGFVQTVLVPELTVMLVKEDMEVDDEGARQIVRQSMAVGDLLNEAPNDVVKQRGRRTSLAN